MSLAQLRAGFLARLQDRLQDRVEGLILLCTGALLAALALSPHYWNFLNPKFAPLTLGTGALLGVCGLTLLLWPQPGRAATPRLTRQIALLGFLCLAATAWDQAASQGPPPSTFTAPTQAIPQPPASSRITKNGVEYLRLNLAELYIMLDKGRTDYPAHFALRAPVSRPGGLRGQALLSRTAVTCCLADSLELGFLAVGSNKVLGRMKDGQWVEAFGRLEPLDEAGKAVIKTLSGPQGLSLRVVNHTHRIIVEAAEPTPAPDPPFLFESREQEPFAW